MVQTASGQVLPNAQAVTWRDVSQSYVTELNADGKPVTGYRITFTTQSGVRGSVFVAQSMYSAQNVIAAIARHAAELETINASTSAKSAY